MKKLVIATAVASALMAGAAAADTTVYGRLNLSWGTATPATTGAADEVGFTDEASRFGMKGSEDLGNGMSTVYQIEYGVEADAHKSSPALRVAIVGLKGDFGTVQMGTQWTGSYLLARGDADPFNAIGGNVYGGGFPAATRTGDSIAYINKFGAATVAFAVVSADATDETVDAWDLGVSIPVGPVTLGIAAADVKNGNSPTAVSVKYADGALSAAATMFDTDNAAGDTWTSVVVGFDMTAKNTITLQMEDDETNTGTNVGISHALSKRTTAFFEVQSGDFGDDTRVSLKHNF